MHSRYQLHFFSLTTRKFHFLRNSIEMEEKNFHVAVATNTWALYPRLVQFYFSRRCTFPFEALHVLYIMMTMLRQVGKVPYSHAHLSYLFLCKLMMATYGDVM